MNNAIMLHGAGETPDSFWFPYIRAVLEKRGYKIWCPQLPDADKINTDSQLKFVLSQGQFNEDTVIIGHSSACRLILSVLERVECVILRAILVSGCVSVHSDKENEVSSTEFQWDKIRKSSKNFVFINSDNDPWGCSDSRVRYMFDRLGGVMVITHDGHMGSTRFNQPYREFPLLLKFID